MWAADSDLERNMLRSMVGKQSWVHSPRVLTEDSWEDIENKNSGGSWVPLVEGRSSRKLWMVVGMMDKKDWDEQRS